MLLEPGIEKQFRGTGDVERKETPKESLPAHSRLPARGTETPEAQASTDSFGATLNAFSSEQQLEKNSSSVPNSPRDGNGISPETPDVGSLPSKGSAGHAAGTCKRCCFFPRGRCMSGQDCMFCHFDHEKRKRKSKSKRSSLGSSTLNSNDSTGEDVQWDEVAKDILGMLRGSTSDKGGDSPVRTATPTPIAPIAPSNRQEIKIGGEYEGKAADGSWWPCRITANNYDGTFEASVHDAYNSKWSNVHRMNLRPTQHTAPTSTRFDGAGRDRADLIRGGRGFDGWGT